MTFLVWVYTSQDFARTQQNFALSHDGETVTFRNSGAKKPEYIYFIPSSSQKAKTLM